jgi:uncharacterized OB-fold protein
MTADVTDRPAPKRPVPNPPPESRPFWAAAAEHRLLMPKCRSCGKFWFPPSILCTHCTSDDTTWEEVSGKGKVFSFVVFHRVYHPAFAKEVPYTVGVVELDEGPRMLSNVVGVAPDQVRCGMPVTVVYDDVTDSCSLPKFKAVSQ